MLAQLLSRARDLRLGLYDHSSLNFVCASSECSGEIAWKRWLVIELSSNAYVIIMLKLTWTGSYHSFPLHCNFLLD